MTQYCTYCGSILSPGERFCTGCGAAVTAETPVQPYPEAPYPQQPYNAQVMQPVQPDMPMKWFKFVIYFQLFTACVFNGINGLRFASGGQYEGMADTIYLLFPDLQIYDVIYGAALMVFAVFALVARWRLSKFCSNGPKLYHVFQIAGIVIPILYTVAVSNFVSVADVVFSGQFLGGIIGSIIMLVCNVIYFNKRSHLFVNP